MQKANQLLRKFLAVSTDEGGNLHFVSAVGECLFRGAIAHVPVGISADEGHFKGRILLHRLTAGIVPLAGCGAGDANIIQHLITKPLGGRCPAPKSRTRFGIDPLSGIACGKSCWNGNSQIHQFFFVHHILLMLLSDLIQQSQKFSCQIFTGSFYEIAAFHLISSLIPSKAGGDIAEAAVGIATHKGEGEGGAFLHLLAAGIVKLAGSRGKSNVSDGKSRKIQSFGLFLFLSIVFIERGLPSLPNGTEGRRIHFFFRFQRFLQIISKLRTLSAILRIALLP